MRKGAREGGEGASPSRELEKNERITEGRKVKEEEEEVVAAEEKEEGGREDGRRRRTVRAFIGHLSN